MAIELQRKAADTSDTGFRDEASRILTPLGQACLGIISRFPGRPVSRPADLDKALGIGNRPAWQIYRFAHSTDPLAQARNVPGPGPMLRFFRAAAERGVPSEHIRAAEAAYAAFQDFVRTHTADRRSFDSIVSRYEETGSGMVDLQHRRAAYRANSHIWGVHSRVLIKCAIYGPSSRDPATHIDAVGISAYVDLRRLRPVRISLLARDVPADTAQPTHFEPLVPEEALGGVPVLQAFCSQPLPGVRMLVSGGLREFELFPGGVGQESESSFIVGHVLRELTSPYLVEGEGPPSLSNRLQVGHPVEVLVQDTLVDAERFPPLSGDAKVFGLKGHVSLASPDVIEESNRLDFRESVARLGRGIEALHAPEVPRYREIVALAFERLGWDPRRFLAFRCRIEYPVLHSLVVTRLALPDSPR